MRKIQQVNLTFDQKIIELLKILNSLEDRYGNIIEILNSCSFDYNDSDIDEFISHFKNDKKNLIEISQYSAGNEGHYLTLTQKGVDYLNEYPELEIQKQRNEETKNLLFLDLQKRMGVFEKQIIEQSKFHRTGVVRNKYQIRFIYFSVLLGIVNLFLYFFK